MDKTDFLLRLKLQKNIGYLKMLRIASKLDSEKIDAFQLQELPLPDNLVEACLHAFYDHEADMMLKRIKRQCQVISFFDDAYPEKLRQIYRPPLLLFARGDLSLLKREMVAIVGARLASSYSRRVVDQLMPNLVAQNLAIVSGLANGADGMAHQAALRCKGKTVAVLGNGLNHFYPASHQNMQKKICRTGLVLSEYLPDTPPRPWRFPERNRIIAGLCEHLIVTEAKAKSGSLITANLALQENRNVFAVPGPITSSLSQGTNQLIKAGATPLIDFVLPRERFDKPRADILFSE